MDSGRPVDDGSAEFAASFVLYRDPADVARIAELAGARRADRPGPRSSGYASPEEQEALWRAERVLADGGAVAGDEPSARVARVAR